eukprot:6492005-Amphidinium_carterae.2
MARRRRQQERGILMTYFDTLSEVRDTCKEEQRTKDMYEQMRKSRQRPQEKRRREEDEADLMHIRDGEGEQINKFNY